MQYVKPSGERNSAPTIAACVSTGKPEGKSAPFRPSDRKSESRSRTYSVSPQIPTPQDSNRMVPFALPRLLHSDRFEDHPYIVRFARPRMLADLHRFYHPRPLLVSITLTQHDVNRGHHPICCNTLANAFAAIECGSRGCL